MTPTAPLYSTRGLSAILVAAFAGVALWLFVPAFNGTPVGDSSPSQQPSLLQVEGDVSVTSDEAGDIVSILISVTVHGDQSVNLNDYKVRAESALAETALAAVPATFLVEERSGNGDGLLDPGETAVLSVTLASHSSIGTDNPLDIVFTSATGPTLIIDDVLDR